MDLFTGQAGKPKISLLERFGFFSPKFLKQKNGNKSATKSSCHIPSLKRSQQVKAPENR